MTRGRAPPGGVRLCLTPRWREATRKSPPARAVGTDWRSKRPRLSQDSSNASFSTESIQPRMCDPKPKQAENNFRSFALSRRAAFPTAKDWNGRYETVGGGMPAVDEGHGSS